MVRKMTKSCLAVIPARGGSKGISKKNIQLVGDKPLLCYAIDSILDSGINADIVVSTDSDEIAQVALDHGGAYVIKRPESISGDGAKTEDALLDALDQMKSLHGKTYEVVLTVQPTSPFRKSETVKRFWDEFSKIGSEYDAMLTLNETRTDYWVEEEGNYHRLYPDAPRRRQDRKPLYIENSCLYATTVNALRETHSVLGNNVQGFLIDEREALDINEPIDLVLANLLSENLNIF